MKQIAIVGLGYIGLPTAILSAQNGYKVLGFDIDEEKVLKIQNGNPTIVEPEINGRLLNVLKQRNFKATSKLEPADCFVIAVPTPFKEEKVADLSYVFDAAKSVANVFRKGNLVILESTVPVGATQKVVSFLEKESGFKAGVDFFIAYCPERVLPGKIFQELVLNDRVIGGINQNSAKLAKDFYSAFVEGELYLTDDKTAEMVKLVENSFRDVQIAFANEVAAMANNVGIDPYKLIEFTNKHPRVNVLRPGCGVGGHCIAVDPWFLIKSFPKETKLLPVARKINDARPNEVIGQILEESEKFKQGGEKPKVLALGLTFKPDVGDLRQSPALTIAFGLSKKRDDLDLFVCEPNVSLEAIKLMGFKAFSLLEGIEWADIVVSLVAHKQFLVLSEKNLKNKEVLDFCGLLNNIKINKESHETTFFAKRTSLTEECPNT